MTKKLTMTHAAIRQFCQSIRYIHRSLQQRLLALSLLLLVGSGSFGQSYDFTSNFSVVDESFSPPGSASGVYAEGSNPALIISATEQGTGSCGMLYVQTSGGTLFVTKCGIGNGADADALLSIRLNSGNAFPLTSMRFRAFCYRLTDQSPYETASFTFRGFKNNVQTGSFTLNNLQHAVLNTITFSNYTGFNDVDELQVFVNNQEIGIEDLVMSPSSPTITTSGTLSAFSSCSGSASSQQSFTVSGTNLSANLVVTAPTGFEVSTSSGSGYGSSVSLTPSSGTVANTTIYVRMASSATGTPNGNVTSTSTGATTRNVSASGTVNALPTITLGTVTGVSTSATSFSIPYSATTGSPNQYSLSTTAPSSMSGFSNVTNASLASSPLSISIPASPANTYNFSLSVRNSTTGCSSSATGFTLTVSSPIVAPSISTTAAATIQSTSATLGGNVTADGGASVTVRGIVYSSTDATPTIGESGVTNVTIGSGTGSFSQSITGLTFGTTYYYNSYATNSAGTSYGTVSSFAPQCDGSTEGSLAIDQDASTISISGSGLYLATTSSCRTLALVTPSGGSPVSGSVSGKVWVRNTVPTFNNKPFVPRSYEITPSSNAATATGTVTLYFTQSDFDAYNNTYNGADLPYNSTDAEGLRFNARIYKFSGTSSDGSGMPGTYTQPGVSITPSSVVWNSSMNRWEVSFSTTGFSGFFLGNNTQLLPIVLSSFSGRATAQGNELQWQTSVEEQAKEMQLERSADGNHFATIATLPAKGKAATYQYTDKKAIGVQYYRLKLVDKDGTAVYSQVIKLATTNSLLSMQLYPNPASGQLYINSNAKSATITIYNVTGAVMLRQNWKPGQVMNIAQLPAGTYIVELTELQHTIRERIVKQ